MPDLGRFLPRGLREDVFEPSRRDLRNDAARARLRRGAAASSRLDRLTLVAREWLLWLDCWRQAPAWIRNRRRERHTAAHWITRAMEALVQDVGYTLRGFRRTPGMTLAALVVLTAAMGLNTSLFSGFNAVLLRPWPLPDAGRVASVFAARGVTDINYGGWPVAEITYLRDHAKTIDLVGLRDEQVEFEFQPQGTTLFVRIATSNYFSTLGVGIQLGRGFEAGDDRRESPRAVAVLSDRIWRDEYSADPNLVGATIALNTVPFMVIGIASPDAMDSPLDRSPAAWLPFSALPLLSSGAEERRVLTDPRTCCSDLVGRLRDDATHRAANTEIDSLSRQFRRETTVPFVGVLVTGTALIDTPRAGTATPIFGLMFAGMLLVLMLACANVGNVLLARGLARQTEVRVRLSLGAGRSRIIRQFMTESWVLAAIAGAASLPIAIWLPARIVAEIDPGLALTLNPTPDLTVWMFVTVVMTLSSLAFGLVPAFRATRAAARFVATGRDGGDRGTVRLRLGLLASQVGISTVLLVSAALLLRAVQHAAMTDPGFKVDEVAVATAILPPHAFKGEQLAALERAVLADMATGGAADAAATSREPLGQRGTTTRAARLPGETATSNRTVEWIEVSSDYFAVMHIPLVHGRVPGDVSPADEVVVSEALARQLWPGQRATGRKFLTGDGESFEVVGVARDARVSTLDEISPVVFERRGAAPASTSPADTIQFVLRNDPAVEARLAAALADLAPGTRLLVKPLSANVAEMLKPSRIGASLAAGIGIVAVAMAAIGVFGVFSYLVAARRREIGVRLALGASGTHIARVVLGSAGSALMAGLAAGMALSGTLAPVLRQYLYGTSPLDPIALGAAAAVLGGAAIIATLAPLRRALGVDPAVTLRQD